MTIKTFAERYLREHVARVREQPALIRRYLERDIYPVIGNKALASVQKQELRGIIFGKIAEGMSKLRSRSAICSSVYGITPLSVR